MVASALSEIFCSNLFSETRFKLDENSNSLRQSRFAGITLELLDKLIGLVLKVAPELFSLLIPITGVFSNPYIRPKLLCYFYKAKLL